MNNFQERIIKWFNLCFGGHDLKDKNKRNSRFFEEAVELVQAADMSKDEAHKLVDHVYSRPKGEVAQEVGGVLTTLMTLLEAHELKLEEIQKDALLEAYERIEEIRAKSKLKPNFAFIPEPFTSVLTTPVEVAFNSASCQRELMEAGQRYPRTCALCGLTGPCVKGYLLLQGKPSKCKSKNESGSCVLPNRLCTFPKCEQD